MESEDELLSWHACGRCGHVFLPPPDPSVVCPACAAAHAWPSPRGVATSRDPAVIVDDWFVRRTGARIIVRDLHGNGTYGDARNLYFPRHSEIVTIDGLRCSSSTAPWRER